MGFDVDALLDLWTDPLTTGPEAEDRFRELYTDPVTVNGVPLSASDLVARAVAVQAAFETVRCEVLDVCDAGDKVAIAFRMSGRQTGPLGTSAGVLAPTGASLGMRVIDLLTLTDGRISSIWVVADELGALAAIDAVRVPPARVRHEPGPTHDAFGAFVVVVDAVEIRRHGELVQVEPQVFDVLAMLLRERHRVVTRSSCSTRSGRPAW